MKAFLMAVKAGHVVLTAIRPGDFWPLPEEPDLPHRIFGGPSRLHDLKTFFETLVTLERQV